MSEAAQRAVLYLHGFASGPESYKGCAFDEALSRLGLNVRRLDLRLPDRNRLRLSAMIDHTAAAADEHDAVVVAGSSLGGLVAAMVASRHQAVRGALLMAPAFGFAQRWAQSFGDQGLRRWRDGIPLRVPDHAGGPPLAVDFGFYEDAQRLEAQWRAEGAAALADMPMLIFHGAHDETVSIEGSRDFAREHPAARLIELDDGHTLIESLPRMILEGVEFLESQLAVSSPAPGTKAG